MCSNSHSDITSTWLCGQTNNYIPANRRLCSIWRHFASAAQTARAQKHRVERTGERKSARNQGMRKFSRTESRLRIEEVEEEDGRIKDNDKLASQLLKLLRRACRAGNKGGTESSRDFFHRGSTRSTIENLRKCINLSALVRADLVPQTRGSLIAVENSVLTFTKRMLITETTTLPFYKRNDRRMRSNRPFARVANKDYKFDLNSR